MDAVHVEQLLQMLECDKIKRGHNAWINASCPLSRWKHSKGYDANPSFGVSIEPTGASKYKCHTCGTSGELTYLVWTLARASKRDLSAVMQFVQLNNAPSELELRQRVEAAAEYWTTDKPKKIAGIEVNPQAMERRVIIPELPILEESELDKLRDMPGAVRAYLKDARGLLEQTILDWELGYHQGAHRIAIPIRDCNKALVGISGRAYLEGQKPKYLHSSGFRGAFYLYGEDRAKRGGRVVLVEGFFDVIMLRQNGYNAVAMQGSHISPFQVQKLKEFFGSVLILPDGDAPGYEAARKSFSMINKALPASVADMPEGLDPDQLDEELRIRLLGDPDL